MKEFLDVISPSLKKSVSIKIFSEVIKENTRFKTVFDLKQKAEFDALGYLVNMDDIVSMMISKFETVLNQPEDIIIEQLEQESNSMFLISDGACQVKITDEKKNVRLGKLLRSGDYFGEVSLVYDCPRTATVQSTKYSTMAELKKGAYKEILILFPFLVDELKQGIFRYNDRLK